MNIAMRRTVPSDNACLNLLPEVWAAFGTAALFAERALLAATSGTSSDAATVLCQASIDYYFRATGAHIPSCRFHLKTSMTITLFTMAKQSEVK